MTERERRAVRKRGRERTKKYRAAHNANSDVSVYNEPTSGPSRQSIEGLKTIKKNLQRYKQLSILQSAKIKSLTQALRRKDEKMEKMKTKSTPDKIEEELGLDKLMVPNSTKRKLVYGEMVLRHLETQPTTKTIADIVTPPKIKKYGLLKEHSRLVSYKLYRSLVKKARILSNRQMQNLKKRRLVEAFLSDDSNSQIVAGKKETRTKNKIKMQKRMLLDSMANLYKKFLKEHSVAIGFSSFCKLKPFYVLRPQVENRMTCLCQTCSNFKMVAQRLRQEKVLKYGNTSELINHTNLTVTLEPEMESKMVTFHVWESVKKQIITRKGTKEVRINVKEERTSTLKNLMDRFFYELGGYQIHKNMIAHQEKIFKDLKSNLKIDELYFHVDFSENYNTKYHEEIQSFHFGSSRKQISIHTGMLYFIQEDGKLGKQAFATLSKNTDHQAHAIVAHMEPIFDMAKQKIGNRTINTIHFQSDGPTSQYRNQFILALMKSFLPKSFPDMTTWVWNYSVAGHGKGAVDGVGAAVKQASDRCVAHGGTVLLPEDIVKALPEKTSIFTAIVEDERFVEVKALLETLPKKPFPGIMEMHQIVCTKGHFKTLKLSKYPLDGKKLRVEDVYSSDTDPDTDGIEKAVLNGEVDTLEIGGFAVVRVKSEKGNHYGHYVCEVTKKLRQGGYEVTFYKKSQKGLRFTKTDEVDYYVETDDIVTILSKPVQGNSSRFKHMVSFSNDLSQLENILK